MHGEIATTSAWREMGCPSGGPEVTSTWPTNSDPTRLDHAGHIY